MNRNILGRGFSFPFSNDVKGNISLSSYEQSIEESIRLILSTSPGERLMRPDFGCAINDILFSPNSPRTLSLAKKYVEDAIVRWEPRVILKEVRGEFDDYNPVRVNIHIEYEIRSVNTFFNMVYPFYLERGEIDSQKQLG